MPTQTIIDESVVEKQISEALITGLASAMTAPYLLTHPGETLETDTDKVSIGFDGIGSAYEQNLQDRATVTALFRVISADGTTRDQAGWVIATAIAALRTSLLTNLHHAGSGHQITCTGFRTAEVFDDDLSNRTRRKQAQATFLVIRTSGATISDPTP